MPRSPGEPNAHTFASVLRRGRERAGLTQAELAGRAGVGVRTVSNLERGINTSPYPSTVRLLADALEVSDSSRDELMAAAARRPATTDPPAGGHLGAKAPTPLVGRYDERAEITRALAAAARGEGSVVLLAGEPGIGKTRLAQEAMAEASARGFLVAGGRCFEQQADAPFVPLLEAFAALHHGCPTAVRDGLGDRWPALATLLPDVLPPAAPADVPDAAHALHRAATAFVRELAAVRPVALVVDDLHWADDASADLLLHLVRHTHRDRFVLLGAYRDAEVGSAHPVRALAHALRRERLTRAVSVGRLDREATAQLVSLHLAEPGVVAELGDLVHRSSEGNPFFTREIVTALVERGDLTRVDGRWVCRELDGITAPASVSEAIGQRVARLPTTARELLEAASVLGTTFDPDDVPNGIAPDDDALDRGWADAVASGLLVVAEDEYAFDHSLTQQALHLGMSPVRRRRVHRRVGELLEGRPVATRRRRAAEIARHLEAGGLPQRALPYVLLAGEVAAAAYARAEAVRLLGHARELAEEIGDEEAITTSLERTGLVELVAGRYDDALGPLLEAAQRHRRTGDAGALLRVEGMVADVRHRSGDGEAAATRLEEVLEELQLGTAPDAWVDGGAALANGLARVRLYLGQHERCVEATELAARLARLEGSSSAEAQACAVGGTALFFLDRPDDAVRTYERGVTAAASIDAPAWESTCLMGLQWAATISGELARSRQIGERGLELTQRAGNTDQESQHAAGLGRAHFLEGDEERARHHLERGRELTHAGSPTLFSGIPPLYLGQLCAAQGDVAGAIACFDEAAAAPDLQTFAFAGYLQTQRAGLDLRAGDAAGALARLEPWLGQEAPTKVHDAAILVAATQACLALGDGARARRLAERGLRRAEAIGNRIDRVDLLRLLGRCHRLADREPEGRQLLDEALDLAVAIGYPAAAARVRAEYR